MASEQHPKACSVPFASTFAFMVCFAVWMMFGVIGIPIRQALKLNNTEFGLLTSWAAWGLHVPFESARARIAQRLREAVMARALAQYVQVLAGQADVRGVELRAAASPLVQ